MSFFYLILFVSIVSLLFFYFSSLLTLYVPYFQKKIIYLKANKTHNNRTLKFTKDYIYKFYIVDDHLLLNEDDSGYRDNYTFFGIDIRKDFEPTDKFSKIIYNKIREK